MNEQPVCAVVVGDYSFRPSVYEHVHAPVPELLPATRRNVRPANGERHPAIGRRRRSEHPTDPPISTRRRNRLAPGVLTDSDVLSHASLYFRTVSNLTIIPYNVVPSKSRAIVHL